MGDPVYGKAKEVSIASTTSVINGGSSVNILAGAVVPEATEHGSICVFYKGKYRWMPYDPAKTIREDIEQKQKTFRSEIDEKIDQLTKITDALKAKTDKLSEIDTRLQSFEKNYQLILGRLHLAESFDTFDGKASFILKQDMLQHQLRYTQNYIEDVQRNIRLTSKPLFTVLNGLIERESVTDPPSQFLLLLHSLRDNTYSNFTRFDYIERAYYAMTPEYTRDPDKWQNKLPDDEYIDMRLINRFTSKPPGISYPKPRSKRDVDTPGESELALAVRNILNERLLDGTLIGPETVNAAVLKALQKPLSANLDLGGYMLTNAKFETNVQPSAVVTYENLEARLKTLFPEQKPIGSLLALLSEFYDVGEGLKQVFDFSPDDPAVYKEFMSKYISRATNLCLRAAAMYPSDEYSVFKSVVSLLQQVQFAVSGKDILPALRSLQTAIKNAKKTLNS